MKQLSGQAEKQVAWVGWWLWASERSSTGKIHSPEAFANARIQTQPPPDYVRAGRAGPLILFRALHENRPELVGFADPVAFDRLRASPVRKRLAELLPPSSNRTALPDHDLEPLPNLPADEPSAPPSDSEAARLWELLREWAQADPQTPPAVFAAYLAPCQPAEWDGASLRVRATSPQAKQWLTSRWATLLGRFLTGQLGLPAQVIFEAG